MLDHRARSPLRRLALAAGLVLLALAAGCSSKDYDPTADWSKERLYREAKRAMDNAEFQQAIDYFEILEARYPFGPLALQAQLEIAYSYYKYGQNEAAIEAASRFIKLHPTHEGVAYAYYLRGLIRFSGDRSILNDLFPREMSQMDQERLEKAFSDFRTIVAEHPDSSYAPDARKRLVYLRNQMAEHEYEVARFYFERTAYTAAVNRIDFLLNRYDRAPVVPDALALQARAYERLGLADLAADTRRVLARSFPDRAPGAQASAGDADASASPGTARAAEAPASAVRPPDPGEGTAVSPPAL